VQWQNAEVLDIASGRMFEMERNIALLMLKLEELRKEKKKTTSQFAASRAKSRQ